MNNKIFLYLRLLFGSLILLLLFYKIGTKDILYTLTEFNLIYLIPVLIIYLLTFLVTNYRIIFLLKSIGKSINFFRLFKYNLLTFSMSCFFPSGIGDALIVYFLKKEKIEIGEGTAIFLINHILSFIAISIFAIPAFFIFFSLSKGIYLMIILVLITVIVIFFIFNKVGNLIIKKFVLKRFSTKFKGFSKTYTSLIKNNKKELILNFIFVILKLMLDSLIVFFLFISFNVYVSLYYIIIIKSVITIISLIPLSINGLGIRESLAVFFYGMLNVNILVVISVYILLLISKYLIALLVIIAFFKKNVIKI